MRFQTELIPARLIRRYKRFLADCLLDDGREITAHCPNPGSMMGLAEPGMKIWLEPNDDPKKKLKYAWRLVDHEDGHFTGIDTSLPNRVIKEALLAGKIAPFLQYTNVRPEVKYGTDSRIDFLLEGPDLTPCYVEVKSVTLKRHAQLAEFPDCVSARGTKHLNELIKVIDQGFDAQMLYLLQRTDCTGFTLAKDLDPAYHEAYLRAREAGVKTICLSAQISPLGIEIGDAVAIEI